MATLDAVLQALPSEYSKDTHKIIKEHVTNLTRTFTNLKPMIPPPSTRPPKLQQCSFILEGTIPVTCIMGGGQTGNFNIPIRIWLEPKYPKQWPTVILNPTANMIIAQNHKHVDAQGVCYCQYLTDWVRDTKKKNLMDLILELCRIFGGAPPLYEQRQPVQPPPGHWGNQGLHNGYVPPAGAGYPPQYYPTQQYPVQPLSGYSNPICGAPIGVPPSAIGGHATGPQPTPSPPAPAPAPVPVPATTPPTPATVTPVPAAIPPSSSAAAVEEDNQCVVCMSDKKTMLFLPCKHLATCEACSGLIGDSCPTCRAKIETKMKIYT